MVSSSGLRGIVGEHLTARVVEVFVRALIQWFPEGAIIVGGDTRTSHQALARFVIAICELCGRDVVYIGICPTPTVQQMVRQHNAAGGIAVTASHNPIEWNGLKMINQSGSFFTAEEYANFSSIYNQSLGSPFINYSKIGCMDRYNTAIQDHVGIITNVLDTSPLKTSKCRVLIDVNHGAAAIADPILFEQFGCHVDYLFSEPDGQFSHSPEPLADNLTDLCNRMKTGAYDIGFAQDPDADRLVIVDETGEFIGEDVSLAFCMDYYLSQMTNYQSKHVVVNLSTSLIISHVAKKYGATLHETKIGEPNVTEKMKATQAIIGGEGNGGVILPAVGWGRDSLTGIVLALLHIETTQRTVSDIVSEYPAYCMVRDKQPLLSRHDIDEKLALVSKHFSAYSLNTEDGVKVLLDDAWVHIRASNTEPIIRIFAEARSHQQAQELVDHVKRLK